MDACEMVARCHRHQWPQEYGRPAVVVAFTPDMVLMVADRMEGVAAGVRAVDPDP